MSPMHWMPCLLLAAAALPAPLAIGSATGHSTVVADDEDPIELDLTELTGIEWEPGEDLPKSVTKYDKKKVIVGGYMHSSTKKDTSTFLLVSNACQCSGSPLVHHFVRVDLGDEMTDFRPGFIEVIGTLSIGEKEDENGFVTSVYRLKGEFF